MAAAMAGARWPIGRRAGDDQRIDGGFHRGDLLDAPADVHDAVGESGFVDADRSEFLEEAFGELAVGFRIRIR